MNYKIGDLVAAEKWTPHGNEHSLGMIIDRKTCKWEVEWYSIQVDIPWYSAEDVAIFRDNYMRLKKKLNL